MSLRSTTCKGMVTVPGGELRCTGNLCSGTLVRKSGSADHKRLQNTAVLLLSTKNRTLVAEFPGQLMRYFSSPTSQVSPIYDDDQSVCYVIEHGHYDDDIKKSSITTIECEKCDRGRKSSLCVALTFTV